MTCAQGDMKDSQQISVPMFAQRNKKGSKSHHAVKTKSDDLNPGKIRKLDC
ncbi:hypothetical protein NBRC116591_00700 [Sessilibacter corallicola]|uniref:Uncharacterized protein n=1 Tax=Sessilibacter corallicola TaxID=2904075 RepID=A0ABQ0A3V5_9GAMM